MLIGEIDGLRRQGIDLSGLRVSANAHVIMPYHLLLDRAGEARLGKREIGTTKRGIGPCYADKASRLGIRMQDLLDEKILRQKIAAAMEPKAPLLRDFVKDPSLDLHQMTEDYRGFGDRLAPHIADTPPIAWNALERDRLVVFEGAQGTLLDIDHGTYPFVTSSNPVAGAACVGAGVGPKSIDEVWGISKAYCTRVGAGPFPSELHDEMGDRLREAGHEFGTTTGRARRCGWLDLVALRYAVRVNGLTGLVLTKLDVLTGIDPLPVANALLRPRGRQLRRVPLPPVRAAPRARRDRGPAGLARGHHRRPDARGPARRTRAPTSASSRSSWASPWSPWAWAPAASRSSGPRRPLRAAPVGRRRRLARSVSADHVGGHDHVVQRTGRCRPTAATASPAASGCRGRSCPTVPNSSPLTTNSRRKACPKPNGSPLSRTARMPTTCLPSVWPLCSPARIMKKAP